MKKILASLVVAGLLVCGFAVSAQNTVGQQPVISSFVVETIPPDPQPFQLFLFHVTFLAEGNGTWQLWGSLADTPTLLQSGMVRGEVSLDLLIPGGDFDVSGDFFIVAIDKKGRTHLVLPQ